MKKPTRPKATPVEKNSVDSEKIGLKKLDVAKEVFKIGGEAVKVSSKFADWGKQAQVTKGVVAASHAKVDEAREKTKQIALDAQTKIENTDRVRQQDAQTHVQKMAELQLQYEQMTSLNRDRERVLDKMLEERTSTESLVHSYCALIASSKP